MRVAELALDQRQRDPLMLQLDACAWRSCTLCGRRHYVHLIRQSLKYVPRREFADVARDLKPIYTAMDSDHAHQELERFDEKWGARFPVITQAWLERWEYVAPFCPFLPRFAGSSTQRIEALNRQLRKAAKTKGHFPTEDAARKLIYLAIQNAVPAWTKTRNWTTALLAFKIHFGDRLPD